MINYSKLGILAAYLQKLHVNCLSKAINKPNLLSMIFLRTFQKLSISMKVVWSCGGYTEKGDARACGPYAESPLFCSKTRGEKRTGLR